MNASKGLIIVFTGDGKGKTSAALGIAMRAAGHHKKTVIIQFLKTGRRSGEQMVEIPLIEMHACGSGFFREGDDARPHREAAEQGWEMARNLIFSGSADIVVLDEISHAVNFGFLSKSMVIETLKQKNETIHIVLTGRDMPREIIDSADMVTEMKEIRHPYQLGKPAVEGIDY